MKRLLPIHLICASLLIAACLGPIADPAPAGAVPLVNVRGVVAFSGGINLRSKPSWSAPIVRVLPDGTPLLMLQTSSDWFKVTALERTGWVNSWYTRLIGAPSVAIYRGNPNRKMIALTFDAGSDLGYTQRIIETLEREGVPATFGLTGKWIDQNPSYAAWIIADGFQIVNHTLDHPSYTGHSADRGRSVRRSGWRKWARWRRRSPRWAGAPRRSGGRRSVTSIAVCCETQAPPATPTP